MTRLTEEREDVIRDEHNMVRSYAEDHGETMCSEGVTIGELLAEIDALRAELAGHDDFLPQESRVTRVLAASAISDEKQRAHAVRRELGRFHHEATKRERQKVASWLDVDCGLRDIGAQVDAGDHVRDGERS